MFPYVPFRECPCDYIHFTLKKSYTDPFDGIYTKITLRNLPF